jgi:hypothetical protein
MTIPLGVIALEMSFLQLRTCYMILGLELPDRRTTSMDDWDQVLFFVEDKTAANTLRRSSPRCLRGSPYFSFVSSPQFTELSRRWHVILVTTSA